jgi:hypothetical protein
MAVQKIVPTDGNWSHGADVTLANLDRLTLPNTLEVRYDDGSKSDVRIPVETWQQHRSFTLHVDGTHKVVSATLDPAHKLPEANRANDTLDVK